jgi:mRNA interferase RelE/StbE
VAFRAGWTGPARRDMARLPPRVATAVLVYVEERLLENPWRRTKALGGDLEGTRGARNGDYRILVQIDDDAEVVWVLHVDHRAHAYRPS